MPKQLSDIEKGQTIAYYYEGYSTKCISTKMGRNKPTIRRLICFYKYKKVTFWIEKWVLDENEIRALRWTEPYSERSKRIDLSLREQFKAIMDQRELVCVNKIQSRIKEHGNFSSLWAVRPLLATSISPRDLNGARNISTGHWINIQ